MLGLRRRAAGARGRRLPKGAALAEVRRALNGRPRHTAVAVLLFATVTSSAPAQVRNGGDGAGHRLDLSGYKLVFHEDFSNLSVSPHGPGTRWIAHTPWRGDFGEARFADPRPGFPFGAQDGTFHIEMRKSPDGRWESGLLASADARGAGFSLQYGYFEIRTKLPAGPGVWPAFWLNEIAPSPPGRVDTSVEVDVFEHYGRWPGNFNTTVTVWPKPKEPKPPSKMFISNVAPGSLYSDFHTFGVEVTPQWCTFYFDGVSYWRTPTPTAHNRPFMILVDLALGGGWPIEGAPSPAYMQIDYIKAYAPAGSGR